MKSFTGTGMQNLKSYPLKKARDPWTVYRSKQKKEQKKRHTTSITLTASFHPVVDCPFCRYIPSTGCRDWSVSRAAHMGARARTVRSLPTSTPAALHTAVVEASFSDRMCRAPPACSLPHLLFCLHLNSHLLLRAMRISFLDDRTYWIFKKDNSDWHINAMTWSEKENRGMWPAKNKPHIVSDL